MAPHVYDRNSCTVERNGVCFLSNCCPCVVQFSSVRGQERGHTMLSQRMHEWIGTRFFWPVWNCSVGNVTGCWPCDRVTIIGSAATLCCRGLHGPGTVAQFEVRLGLITQMRFWSGKSLGLVQVVEIKHFGFSRAIPFSQRKVYS